jgi:DNA repair photolyase
MMVDFLPDQPHKGRGAVGRPAGRFETSWAVPVDDGWWRDEDELPRLATTLAPDAARTVITRNTSPDIPFDRSVNPYRGCEHGCIYCFARPSHAYLGLSPGLDFETKIFFKDQAAQRLDAELRKPGYKVAPLALGVNTDAYQPAEQTLGVTRSILEVLSAFNHPVSIITKSARILRDLDILAPMAADGLVHVMLSVTTLDGKLARLIEPRASAPAKRLATIKALAEAGIPVGVLASPMIPGLNDAELEGIIEAAAEAGARQAGYILIRLPLEVKDLFQEWLAAHYPDRAGRVLSLIRQCRAGALNESEFGRRMVGEGHYARLLQRRMRRALKRHGLDRPMPDFDCSRFAKPLAEGNQLALF